MVMEISFTYFYLLRLPLNKANLRGIVKHETLSLSITAWI